MSSAILRDRMAEEIIKFEARRDKAGHLVVYNLPANDGGGRYEVAGINEKYDKAAVEKLVKMIDTGQFAESEIFARAYIAGNTDAAQKWTTIPAVEFYLRDCIFNRGEGGAMRILQRALEIDDHGGFGPITKAAVEKAEKNPQVLLTDLRAAREDYERKVIGVRANFWDGLVNRWNNSLTIAKTFPMTPDVPMPVTKPPVVADDGKAVPNVGKAAGVGGILGVFVLAANNVAEHPVITISASAVAIAIIAVIMRQFRK